MNKIKYYRGFTLIELLVVIGIFVVITTIILGVLVTVLRGAKNSDSLIEVRQNGEFVISRIVTGIRFAQSLDYPNTLGGTAPACSPAGTKVEKITITTTSQTQTNVTCPASFNAQNFIDMNGTRLTNRDTVVVKDCYFICTQSSTSHPVINIYFKLSKINSSGLPEGNTQIPFETSVTLRNIGG